MIAAPTESAFTSTSSSLLVSFRNGVGILTLADIFQLGRDCSEFGFGVEQRFEFAQDRLDFAGFADMADHRVESFESVAGDAKNGGIVRTDFSGLNKFLRDADSHAAGGFSEDAFAISQHLHAVANF